jgi:hypothetical protein
VFDLELEDRVEDGLGLGRIVQLRPRQRPEKRGEHRDDRPWPVQAARSAVPTTSPARTATATRPIANAGTISGT